MRCFILLLILGLSGCYNELSANNNKTAKRFQSKKTHSVQPRYAKAVKDGAPKGPLPTFFQKIKPVFEPLSRYGNPQSYAVEGRNYSVLRTASGYKTRGMASWYGTKFHHQRTSSGEHYDMYAMTAAHKTLPLPTYVKVKNLNNGRVVIVKVNDRGPFHSNRIIDLSYAAAAKLGLMPKGTAPVEIEALNVTPVGKRRVAHYYIQAGAFRSEKLARTFQAKLAKLTPSPVFMEKNKKQYLVQVGPFASSRMTVALQKQLNRNGFHGSFSMLK